MINTIKLIFLDIAKRHRYDDKYWIQTFTHLDKSTDWNNPNMNKKQSDALNGDYWTRKGVNWNDDSKEYPILAFEWMPAQIESLFDDRYGFNVTLTIADQFECETCPSYLTRHEVDIYNHKAIFSIVREFFNYNKYRVVKPDESVWFIYATAEQITAMLDAGTITESRKVCGINNLFDSYTTEIFKSGFIGVDSIRSMSVTLNFTGCTELDEFDYIQDDKIDSFLICKQC
jgi:hypothetical protein